MLEQLVVPLNFVFRQAYFWVAKLQDVKLFDKLFSLLLDSYAIIKWFYM